MTTSTHPPAPALRLVAPAAPHPAAFFEAAHRAFQSATAHSRSRQEHFVIGGQSLRFHFAGDAWLPQFTAALAHRAAPPTARPHLTICVWDSASTGARMPAPPWSSADYSPRGEIAPYCHERYRAGYQLDAGLLSLLDVRRGLALLWTADAARLPRYELTFPARSILYWWAQVQALQMVHAGAVGHAGGGVLLVGKGGSGKSTTALACLQAGLDYAGDDYVLVDDQPTPRAHSLYCSGKLHAGHIGRLPVFLPLIHNHSHLTSEKALLYLNDAYAPQLVADLPLSAIVLPRVTGAARTSYRRVSTVQSLAALAPSTMRQLPGAGPADYAHFSRLARCLPAYTLDLGQDLAEIPAVVLRLIAEAGRR
ncbi:MAG: serine kinase, partial [Anaerolineales bacterium]